LHIIKKDKNYDVCFGQYLTNSMKCFAEMGGKVDALWKRTLGVVCCFVIFMIDAAVVVFFCKLLVV
jgi:hypothetical protein